MNSQVSGVSVSDGAVVLTKAIVDAPSGLSYVLSSTGQREGVDHLFGTLYEVVFMFLRAPDCGSCGCIYSLAQAMKFVRGREDDVQVNSISYFL